MSSTGQYGVACTNGTGKLYYSNTYGTNWTEANQPSGVSTANWVSVSISATGKYAVACVANNTSLSAGKLYWSDNNGVSWTVATQPPTVADGVAFWYSVSISGTGQYAIACVNTTSKSNLYYSTDYGKTWFVATLPTVLDNEAWSSVSISETGKYAIACASSGEIYYSTNSGLSWSVSIPPLNITTANWVSVSISASGQYAVACVDSDTTGKIYYSKDYGVNWTVSTSVTTTWNAVSISATGQYAVACADHTGTGKLYYSNTYGQTWSVSSQPAIARWFSLSISGSGQYAIAGYNNDKIYYSTNNTYSGNVATGYSIAGTDIGDTMNLNTISAVSNTITASGYTTKILQYDTGKTWTATTTSGLTGNLGWLCSAMSANGQYAIAGIYAAAGRIYYSTDYGQTWTISSTQPTDTNTVWTSMSMSASGQYGLASTTSGTHNIYYTSDYGKTWTASTSGAAYWFSVSMSASGQYGLACLSQGGGIFYSSNYGQSWTATVSTVGVCQQVSISASGQYGLACRYNIASGTLLYSCDYGLTWVTIATARNWTCVSISSSGQYGVACATNGTIYYSNDYCQTWTAADTSGLPGNTTWYIVSMSGTGQYALASINSASGTVYYSSNYGKTWAATLTSAPGKWRTISISKSGQYAVGGIEGGRLYYSANTSVVTETKDLADVFEPLYKYKSWSAVGGANTWSGISCSTDGKYVVASIRNATAASGLIYYSSNYGASYTNSNATIANLNGLSMSNTGQYVIACESTTGEGIRRSTDYGASWERATAYQFANWLTVAMSSSGKWAIGSRYTAGSGSTWTGLLYKSSDFGGTWTDSAAITGTPYCAFMAISGNGKYGIACKYHSTSTTNSIYYTTDSGANWTAGTTINANFGGCAMSADGRYAIAGASGGQMYYSLDFGATWIVSNSVGGVSWQGASMSDSGQYCTATTNSGTICYSNDYGVNWTIVTVTDGNTANFTQKIAISKNGQYSFLTTPSGTIWRCPAQNT
jgi:hypothetical protein